MYTIAYFSIDTSDDNVNPFVNKCIEILKADESVDTHVHETGTNLAGEYDDIVRLTKQCMEAVTKMGARRAKATLEFDIRTDKNPTLKEVMSSIKTCGEAEQQHEG